MLLPSLRRRVLSTALRARVRWWVVVVVVTAVFWGAAPGWAWAQTSIPVPQDLHQVVENLRGYLVGFLAGLATLFLTIGGVRYLAADGDPGQVERAKKSLRNALIGYGFAVLAGPILAALQQVVGTP
ncbi:pilin [Saccharopolyspora sp. NPDC003752]